MKHFVLEAVDYPEGQPEDETEHLLEVLTDVADERFDQDRQWGGTMHDDEHGPGVWFALLDCHVMRLLADGGAPSSDYRRRLVKVAALAVAAAQAWDRAHALVEA